MITPSTSSPETSQPDAPPALPAAAAPSELPIYGWLFLVGLALIIAVIDPLIIALQPRLDVSLGLLVVGAGLLAFGLLRHQPPATWAGAVVLWFEIGAGILTQISPLAQPPGEVWGPRGLLLAVAILGWALFLNLNPWLRRGVLALAVPTFIVLVLLWRTAPPFSRNAAIYWLAVDSHGTVYANDIDNGVIWVFDSNGGTQGNLWPRRGTVGKSGPGVVPANLNRELTLPGAVATPTPGGISEREFLFCGLAVDPNDYLYVADPEMFELRQFAPGGQLTAVWKLPETFIPARGCLAANKDYVFLADNHSIIYVYDKTGKIVQQWTEEELPLGLTMTADGRLMVLHQQNAAILAYPSGAATETWSLPPPAGDLQIPYQAILARRNGEVLVTDVSTNQVLRYGADHQALPPIGVSGGWPGQFGGLAALAEDREGRLYISDFNFRVIQRFSPDGQARAVWSAPEDESAGE
jgi:hypothetical protein